jgi:dTDP-4-dehydrorhamnose reductase
MSKPIVLVTGKNGQLGNELQVLAPKYPAYSFYFTDVEELDITDERKVSLFFETYNPAICINTAAYTAVDKAESDRERALKINGDAVATLAASCKKVSARFVQVSTDYVFDGKATTPYTEEHLVSPVNYYGYTKLKGEEAAVANYLETIVIRTSWVYSFFGNNFVKTMMRLMKERECISVVNDQFGSPTYAADLAEAIMQVATAPEVYPGIYHFSNEGVINWFDFAVEIKKQCSFTCSINAVDTSGYPTPAKRPAYSVMSKEKIKRVYDIKLKNWKTSLQKCIDLLKQ